MPGCSASMVKTAKNRNRMSELPENDELIATARHVLVEEARVLQAAVGRAESAVVRAAKLIFETKGKVVVTGVGKSGLVGQKIAATLCSTGTPAVFLHASEAFHGDLGIYHPGDPTILISKSGSTAELVRLVPLLIQLKSPRIAVVGRADSPIGRQSDIVLDIGVDREADMLGIVPTSSATLSLALGDALAVVLMKLRRFSEKDFARFHPAGQLGRNLLLTVAEVMHQTERVALVAPETPLREVLIAMTKFPLGAACVVDGARNLAGIITDGDIRRILQVHDDIRGLKACEVMKANPIRTTPTASLGEAAKLMEDRPSQISVLPVVDTETGKRCLGLLRIHDLYQPHLV